MKNVRKVKLDAIAITAYFGVAIFRSILNFKKYDQCLIWQTFGMP